MRLLSVHLFSEIPLDISAFGASAINVSVVDTFALEAIVLEDPSGIETAAINASGGA
jgi:hypothetical protein